MRKHFIIEMLLTGAVVASLLVGCGKKGTDSFDEGKKAFESGNYAKAVECFQSAVSADSDNKEFLVFSGMAKTKTGDFAGAIEDFDNAISKDSKYRDAYRGKGIAFYRQGNYDSALEQFNLVKEMSGSDYDEVALDSLKFIAAIAYEKKNYQESVDTYTTVLGKCSSSEKASLYFYRGCGFAKLGDENNAALDFETSLDYKDDDYNIYCSMYDNLKAAGFKDRAESFLRRLLNGDNTDDLLFGKVYCDLGEYDMAKSYLENAYYNGDVDAAYYLARAYESEGSYAKADELYKSYLGKHPNDAYIYNQYGVYLINRGSYSNAAVYIENGLEHDDGTIRQQLLYNQAVCYEYMEDYGKALELFESYIAEYPADKKADKEYKYLLIKK